MNEKYIRENKNSFAIYKNSRNYAKFKNLDDAICIRDFLIENDWDLDNLPETLKVNDTYIAVKVIDAKVHMLAKSKKPISPQTVDKLAKRKIRNPNNSKYGLNISRIFETFIIKKQIAGEEHIFGYYDNIEDAQFVRNFLMDHMWNVNEFSKVNFDDDTETYKLVEVIDDKAYVIDTFTSQDEIDIDSSHEKFLAKISKHKFSLASHPYLDELTDKIHDLENEFGVGVRDEVWSFENAENPLDDIIFKLTPFQKSVYDAVDSSSFDDVKKSLMRYRSKNFDAKIQKNLDELVSMGLISKNQNCYKKTNL